MATTEELEPDKHALRRDRWDHEDFVQARTDLPPLRQLEEQLEEVHWTAPRVVADLHQLLRDPSPKLSESKAMQPAFRPNREVVSRLQGMEVVEQVRHNTVGDPFMAGLATSRMQGNLTDLYEQLQEAQEQADQAQQAQDAYDQGCQDAGCQPGSAEAMADAALEALREDAEVAATGLDEALEAMGPVIDQQVRAAGAAAAQEAKDTKQAMAGWGLSPGEAAKLDPSVRLALAERMSTPWMKKVVGLFGRMRSELWAETSKRYDQGPDEVADITMGDDINRMLTTEMLCLLDPDLEVDFLDRYDRGQLLVRELRTRAKEARGGIVYVEDGSGSMYSPSELPGLWARAFGLVLLDVAIRQKRAFKVISFGGEGEMHEFDFGLDASMCSIEQKLDYAEFILNAAGTVFEGPLGKALGFLHDEHEANGRTSADIVFATDGYAGIEDAWAANFRRGTNEIGVRVFGLLLGVAQNDPFRSFEKVADKVAPINRLLNGSDIKSIFADVARPKDHALA